MAHPARTTLSRLALGAGAALAAAVERLAHIAWPEQSFPVRAPEPVPPF